MRDTLVRVLVLFVTGSVAGVVANTVSRDGLPWVIDRNASLNPGENPALAEQSSISLEELRDHFTNMTATFVDARRPEEFVDGHLATAVNIPATEKEKYIDRVFEQLPLDDLIVIYCEGGECDSSNDVFEFLVRNGFPPENLRIFQPGWEVIRSASDLPVTEGGW